MWQLPVAKTRRGYCPCQRGNRVKMPPVAKQHVSARCALIKLFSARLTKRIPGVEISRYVDKVTNKHHRDWQRALRTLRQKDGLQIIYDKADDTYCMSTLTRSETIDAKHPAEVETTVRTRDGNVCVYCGRAMGDPYPGQPGREIGITMGHIRSKQDGGEYTPENLVCECNWCQAGHGAKSRDTTSQRMLRVHFMNASPADQQQFGAWLTSRNTE